jgi:UDP-N-acetylmuramoyl-tripeptide--D-alanyl-D-alanine ligase
VSGFDGEWLREAAHGTWAKACRPVRVSAIGTDTRDDLREKAFLALKGERHDAHGLINEAARRGATLLIVEPRAAEAAISLGVRTIVVESTRQALGDIAAAHRRQLEALSVIGVTGSSGKTTTKRLIHAVLSPYFAGKASEKSFNNDIGVPLTLLTATRDDTYLIAEIGMNHPGEIGALAALAEPDLGVITMVGRAHLGGLGSLEAIAQEKASLLNHLRSGGLAVVHADSPGLEAFLPKKGRIVRFGEGANSTLQLVAREVVKGGQRIALADGAAFVVPLAGKHNAVNALAAIAIGREFGLKDHEIAEGLAQATPAPMRLELQRHGELDIYNDAYNANPESMAAAIDTFAELTTGSHSRVLVLGEMLELGDEAEALHAEVGRRAAKLHLEHPFRLVVTVGANAETMATPIQTTGADVLIVPTLTPEACADIVSRFHPGDSILLKASRGTALERILAHVDAAQPAGV